MCLDGLLYLAFLPDFLITTNEFTKTVWEPSIWYVLKLPLRSWTNGISIHGQSVQVIDCL